MPDLTGRDKVDRLPILLTVCQLLAVPKLVNGTGEAISNSIVEVLNEWNVLERACGICFDTTASNTGKNTGACTLLESKLNKRLLSLACR